MVTCALFLLRSLTQVLWKQQLSGNLSLCKTDFFYRNTVVQKNLIFFLCLLQVKWNLCRCCIHLVQVFLPKCCNDLFMWTRNFLFQWVCSMLHSCNFDYCQDYIYLPNKNCFLKSDWKDTGIEIPAYNFHSFLVVLNREGCSSVPHFADSD